MDKNKFWLLPILLILIVAPFSAASKTASICPILKFQGEMGKNRDTKQKEPIGQGILFVPDRYSSELKDARLTVEGNFEGNVITNAAVCIKGKSVYEGKATYNYSYDKDSKELKLNINFTDGNLLSPKDSYSRKNTYSVLITPNTGLSYNFIFENDKSIFHIQPSVTQLSYHSNLYPTSLCSKISDLITDSEWCAIWNNGEWQTFWTGSTLKNGMTASPTNDSHDLKFYGDKNTYFYVEKSSSPRLRLPLRDGGFFEWNKENKILRLTYPTGEIFEGTFSNVPFEFNHHSNSDVFDGSEYPKNPRCGDGELFKQITNASVSDFVPFNGSCLFPDGKREYIVNGENTTSSILKANNGEIFPHFDDIVATHHFVNDDGAWASYSNGSMKKDNKGHNYNGHDGNDLLKRLSKGIMYFAGKKENDALDRQIYLESSQYPRDKQEYDSLRTNQLFYSTQRIETTFSPESLTIKFPGGWNSKLKVLHLDHGPYLPFKAKCIEGWSTWNFDVPIKDIETLKLLKKYQPSLQLVATYRAGEWNDYLSDIIANPIALYLADKTTGAILYDLSYLLGAYSTSDIKRNSEAAKRQDEADERRREAELERMYHKQAIKQACTWCLGKGYLSGYMSVEQQCPNCHGKGYIITHYY